MEEVLEVEQSPEREATVGDALTFIYEDHIPVKVKCQKPSCRKRFYLSDVQKVCRNGRCRWICPSCGYKNPM